MNLKEYIFYSNKTQKEMAEMLDVDPSLIRGIMAGSHRISKKFARNIEKVTNGMVTKEDILGPPSHPEYQKMLNV